MIISKTPFRLSFFGGGTDYNHWFENNGGLILGCSFNKYNYISIRPLAPFFEHHSRVVYSNIERVMRNEDIEHPSIRNCLKFKNITDGIEIHYDGDLPARSGIGSSSSFTVGMLNALHAYKGSMISKQQLADEAIYLEQEVMKENVGIQDQILASYGGLNLIEMGPGKMYKTSPLILPIDYLENFENHILLGFSGIQRFSTEVAGKQIDAIKNGTITSQMKDIHDIAKEALCLFQKQAPMITVGELFDKTWRIKKNLTNDISSDYINDTYDAALRAGAYGGRLLGAGGGGFMVFIAPPEKHNAIKNALRKNIRVWVPFKFDHHGSQVIVYSPSNNWS